MWENISLVILKNFLNYSEKKHKYSSNCNLQFIDWVIKVSITDY